MNTPTVSQVRMYPPEFKIELGAGDSVVFHGPGAQARAEAYAASLESKQAQPAQ